MHHVNHLNVLITRGRGSISSIRSSKSHKYTTSIFEQWFVHPEPHGAKHLVQVNHLGFNKKEKTLNRTLLVRSAFSGTSAFAAVYLRHVADRSHILLQLRFTWWPRLYLYSASDLQAEIKPSAAAHTQLYAPHDNKKMLSCPRYRVVIKGTFTGLWAIGTNKTSLTHMVPPWSDACLVKVMLMVRGALLFVTYFITGGRFLLCSRVRRCWSWAFGSSTPSTLACVSFFCEPHLELSFCFFAHLSVSPVEIQQWGLILILSSNAAVACFFLTLFIFYFIVFPTDRVRSLPDPHTGSPPVLSPRGPLVGQSELWCSPAQHDPVQWEAASASGWALLPILTGDCNTLCLWSSQSTPIRNLLLRNTQI